MPALQKKNFLFLQTIASPFFKELGKALMREGHAVHKINFNGGDFFFWHGLCETNYTGHPEDFQSFLGEFLTINSISDIILFGDCRPWHMQAISSAEQKNIDIWVFEEGYLRPHWVTLEKGGVNANSPFQLSSDSLNSENAGEPLSPDVEMSGGFKQRVFYDFVYNGANFAFKWKFPHHKTHRPYPILKEYASWSRRLFKLTLDRKRPDKIIASFIQKQGAKYLFPLQLDSDFQLRAHSPFKTMPEAIQFVLQDFARHSPAETHLLIKNHPLDNGLINYKRQIETLARDLGVSKRISYIDGGDLNQILEQVNGVVTINSTVGITALENGLPVMLLGKAIYDIEGLVHSMEDKEFWSTPTTPKSDLAYRFQSELIEESLVNGNFYTRTGISCAVKNSIARIKNSANLPLE
ncbi:MAG: capsular biosynthesis protein [Sneathiellales bacterium]|nr:capsular biosynthesis protein [Sneathiellales bacterium]